MDEPVAPQGGSTFLLSMHILMWTVLSGAVLAILVVVMLNR